MARARATVHAAQAAAWTVSHARNTFRWLSMCLLSRHLISRWVSFILRPPRRYRISVTDRSGPAASQPLPAGPRLSYLVFRLERRIRSRLDDALARHGMTTTEYMALSELRLRSGVSSAQLARAAFVTPQAMNQVIRDLEQRGLIRRKPGRNGGRVLHTSLSRAGLSTLERCDHALDEIEQVMLATLNEETRQALAAHLTACGQALHPAADQPHGAPARRIGRPEFQPTGPTSDLPGARVDG